MKTVLDNSHICLVRNWATFQTMQSSSHEVELYLRQAARSAIAEMKNISSLSLTAIDDKLDKQEWFDLYPSKLKTFCRGGMRFGLEYIQVEAITNPDAQNPCWAYVWMPDENSVLRAQVRSFLAGFPIPEGFRAGLDAFIYTSRLPTLKPEEFANPGRLKHAFCAPFSRLFKWYSKNADAFHRFRPKSQRRVRVG